MKPVVELHGATAELEQAVAWYEQRELGLGERLYVAFQEACVFVRRDPKAGMPFDLGTRKWRVRGFPYKIIYVELPEEILICRHCERLAPARILASTAARVI